VVPCDLTTSGGRRT